MCHFLSDAGVFGMGDVAREIEAMKVALKVELDRELAEELQIDASAVAAWRRRQRVPEKYRIRFNVVRDEALSKEIEPSGGSLWSMYIFSLVAVASILIDKFGYFLAEEEESFNNALMAQRISRFYGYLVRTIPVSAPKAELRVIYERMRKEMLAADDILDWLDAHA